MMNRLQCTYEQLRLEPHAESEVFKQFAAGEADALKLIQEQNKS